MSNDLHQYPGPTAHSCLYADNEAMDKAEIFKIKTSVFFLLEINKNIYQLNK